MKKVLFITFSILLYFFSYSQNFKDTKIKFFRFESIVEEGEGFLLYKFIDQSSITKNEVFIDGKDFDESTISFGKFYKEVTNKNNNLQGVVYKVIYTLKLVDEYKLNSEDDGEYVKSGKKIKKWVITSMEKAHLEIEFMMQLKIAVINDDKTWIANHIGFPIQVNVSGELLTINNPQKFIENYEHIFYPRFNRLVVEMITNSNFFSINKGKSIGNEAILINNWDNKTAKDRNFLIVEINN